MEKHKYKVGDFIVYPVHGVGEITAIEECTFDTITATFLVIKIAYEKLTLKIPLKNADKLGVRPLFNKKQINEIEDVLKRRVRMRRMMWSRRAQEYETKINSGDPVLIAEVVRELYKKNDYDQSYSERQIYQTALSRLAKEFAIVKSMKEDAAYEYIRDILEAA
ncbi:MAG: CarD family transcriptional regulator [Alphaproteobacteria bacterium]|nr:MAG: CarD family transcriptional regulator [Alphaproteobacteria bacterium]